MENSDYIKNRDNGIEELERYSIIMEYFIRNRDRINANKKYLKKIYDFSEKDLTESANKMDKRKISRLENLNTYLSLILNLKKKSN
jgi:hypothetical protein